MNIQNEPLSWEVLAFWKRSGLPVCPIHPASLFTARDADGKLCGMVALGANRPEGTFVIEPLIARSGLIGELLVEALEKRLVSIGAPGYFFYLDEHTPDRQRRAVERMADNGIFRRLGEDEESQASWYARRFQDFLGNVEQPGGRT